MGFDFDAAVLAPFRMQPGLRRLAPGAPQLSPMRPGDRALKEKLAAPLSFGLTTAPGFDPSIALAALSRHAAEEHPDAWVAEADGGRALQLGWSVRGDTPMPQSSHSPDAIGRALEGLPRGSRLAGLIALAFAEDFAIVDAASGTIPWLAVCLPSHWAPEEKIGRAFAEVHAPVAENTLLLKAGDHLVRLVTGAERWERFVWSISAHPHLNAHPRQLAAERWPAGASVDEIAAQAHWRTERQTFIPVAGHGQAVFTIGIGLQPLAEAIDTPARAAQVHAALASMSPAVLAYRGLADARDRLLAWLAARAA